MEGQMIVYVVGEHLPRAALIAVLLSAGPVESPRVAKEPMPLLPPTPLKLNRDAAPPWARVNRRQHYRQRKPGGTR